MMVFYDVALTSHESWAKRLSAERRNASGLGKARLGGLVLLARRFERRRCAVRLASGPRAAHLAAQLAGFIANRLEHLSLQLRWCESRHRHGSEFNLTSTCLFKGTHRSAAKLNSLPDAEQKLALGPTWLTSSPTQNPQPSPPRRRRCAQVRERCMSVATISHAPQLFLRVRVDQHPTHHPSPAPTVLFSKAKCQGPRARPDDPRAHAHVRRAAHRGARARHPRRFEVGRRRSAQVQVERR